MHNETEQPDQHAKVVVHLEAIVILRRFYATFALLDVVREGEDEAYGDDAAVE